MKVDEAVRALGVRVQDSAGNLRHSYDVWVDVAHGVWRLHQQGDFTILEKEILDALVGPWYGTK